ncbi:hypothetical protein [Sulfurisphaera tokodaii]|uniref:Uncharacterized protein n=2 Tax=Sulfurisphaera tokodaii TaxID=111955 RepID=Q975A2_SULTO|nr:hypothetical protein [Sulfurisphaera tokodaii]BAB65505.1 hypothetical protein STK_05110 [Sulfurisphaera tokodaii str. 7]HII74795.1 hypothetical protein [Sulfurisphaera tokodaii]
MNILDELKNTYDLSDEDIEYALQKAKGILLGFAMEYKAIRVLENMDFKNVRYVDLPTHDLEAEKCGKKYYIEVKASSKSPTKEYTAHKLAMIAMLDGIHLTLVMKPSPHLFSTEEILSMPKKVLLNFFRYAYKGEVENLKMLLNNSKTREILLGYERIIKTYTSRYSEESLSIIESLF